MGSFCYCCGSLLSLESCCAINRSLDTLNVAEALIRVDLDVLSCVPSRSTILLIFESFLINLKPLPTAAPKLLPGKYASPYDNAVSPVSNAEVWCALFVYLSVASVSDSNGRHVHRYARPPALGFGPNLTIPPQHSLIIPREISKCNIHLRNGRPASSNPQGLMGKSRSTLVS